MRIYWDANTFLYYINGEEALLPVLDALLDSAARGVIAIYTSTISITEVAFARIEQDAGSSDPLVEAQIDQLWADRKTIKLIDFHEGIGKDARRLMREAIDMGRRLRPMDAIHLASALRVQVDEFHTYDKRLHGFAEILPFDVCDANTSSPRLFP